jgi:hypothetical protein
MVVLGMAVVVAMVLMVRMIIDDEDDDMIRGHYLIEQINNSFYYAKENVRSVRQARAPVHRLGFLRSKSPRCSPRFRHRQENYFNWHRSNRDLLWLEHTPT